MTGVMVVVLVVKCYVFLVCGTCGGRGRKGRIKYTKYDNGYNDYNKYDAATKGSRCAGGGWGIVEVKGSANSVFCTFNTFLLVCLMNMFVCRVCL